MRQISDTTLAYWAGVFDIAGCIRLQSMPHGRNSRPLITLTLKDKDFLTSLIDAFGGGIRLCGDKFRWERSGAGAVDIIQNIAPFFKHRKVSQEILLWRPQKRGPIPKPALPQMRVRQVNRLGEW